MNNEEPCCSVLIYTLLMFCFDPSAVGRWLCFINTTFFFFITFLSLLKKKSLEYHLSNLKVVSPLNLLKSWDYYFIIQLNFLKRLQDTLYHFTWCLYFPLCFMFHILWPGSRASLIESRWVDCCSEAKSILLILHLWSTQNSGYKGF